MRGWGNFSYMYAAATSNILAISAAFLGYKWFVFQTKGNYFREWIRCFGVYGGSALVTLAGLPIVVTILRHALTKPVMASYLGAAIMMVITALSSFWGHKYFSFQSKHN
jgi:putative flippase GtrA